MKSFFFFIITILIVLSSCSKTEAILKIGLVADPQYADKATVGNRHYRESLWKLEEAIDTFNIKGVDFVQNLGDIIDIDWGSYDSIIPIYDKLNPDIENYQLLGNHDFAVDKYTDPVGYQFNITENMRAEQNCSAVPLYQIDSEFKKLPPCNRIESKRRVIKYQYLRVDRHRKRQIKLRPHTCR